MELNRLEERLMRLLTENELTVTTAESCTGGMVAAAIVDIPGVSEYFHAGFVTYSEKAKAELLNVNLDTIKVYNVVSVETAQEMAAGAAKRVHADCAIATTGVAGPGGGTEEIPVGCVCFGCVVRGHVFSEKKIFQGSRKEIRNQAAEEAIRFLIAGIEEVIK